MILNSSADLNPGDLFDVALHEAGLALGLSESTDPNSVMYPVINPQATPVAGRHREHPGPLRHPRPDPNGSNGTFATATRSAARCSTSGRRPWWPTGTAPRSRMSTSSRCNRPSSTPGR